MKRNPTRQRGKNGKCLTCPCQKAGDVAPECLRGVIGWLDAEGVRRFNPILCHFDAEAVLAAPPCHGPTPQEHGNYSQGKRCVECGEPASNGSTGRCNPCASRVNGRKSKSNGKTRSPWHYPAARGRGKAQNARASRVR